MKLFGKFGHTLPPPPFSDTKKIGLPPPFKKGGAYYGVWCYYKDARQKAYGKVPIKAAMVERNGLKIENLKTS